MNRKPAQTRQQAIKSLTIAAERKGVTVRSEGREIVVEDRAGRHAFVEPDLAGAYLLVSGGL